MGSGAGAFDKAVKQLKGNSSLKTKAVSSVDNVQTSMMIDREAKKLFRVNGEGTLSAYVNGLMKDDMTAKGWIK